MARDEIQDLSEPAVGPGLLPWQQFVLEHGFRAVTADLAHVIGRTPEEVQSFREGAPCRRLPEGKPFAGLFALWHGRAPEDSDWPAPRLLRSRGGQPDYTWQPPELALLASLCGQIDPEAISAVLTERLRKLTGDPRAQRSRVAVQNAVNRIGLQLRDVVGGITVVEAARDIGSQAVVVNAIEQKQLAGARKVGSLWVIPRASWAKWKEGRVFPPKGYVQLSTLREPLAIRSDKLSEFARMGYIPTAIRCNPCGSGTGGSTKFGSWYVDGAIASQLLIDRRAGRPMPWHGKPLADNLRAVYKKWLERRHPDTCPTCAQIWGGAGAPQSGEDFSARYHPLAHGAKRHLTRQYSPGLTVEQVAEQARCPTEDVARALVNGALTSVQVDGQHFVTRTDATRWLARKCPSGDNPKSWLALETACKLYLFTMPELKALIAEGTLKSRIGTNGAARGLTYVLRQQCAELRATVGFTPQEAARRLRITVERLRHLLEGVDWRESDRIPLSTLQAVRKRLDSRAGFEPHEAARELGTSLEWVQARIADGTVRVLCAPWDRRRKYLSEPMLRRLREALAGERVKRTTARTSPALMSLMDAAREAGVSNTLMNRWGNDGEVKRRATHQGWQYLRHSVRARARRYWQSVRFRRAEPPAWLAAEIVGTEGVRP